MWRALRAARLGISANSSVRDKALMVALMLRIMAAYVRISAASCAPDCRYAKFLLSLKKATSKVAMMAKKLDLMATTKEIISEFFEEWDERITTVEAFPVTDNHPLCIDSTLVSSSST